jgi:hypothetical protein
MTSSLGRAVLDRQPVFPNRQLQLLAERLVLKRLARCVRHLGHANQEIGKPHARERINNQSDVALAETVNRRET